MWCKKGFVFCKYYHQIKNQNRILSYDSCYYIECYLAVVILYLEIKKVSLKNTHSILCTHTHIHFCGLLQKLRVWPHLPEWRPHAPPQVFLIPFWKISRRKIDFS